MMCDPYLHITLFGPVSFVLMVVHCLLLFFWWGEYHAARFAAAVRLTSLVEPRSAFAALIALLGGLFVVISVTSTALDYAAGPLLLLCCAGVRTPKVYTMPLPARLLLACYGLLDVGLGVAYFHVGIVRLALFLHRSPLQSTRTRVLKWRILAISAVNSLCLLARAGYILAQSLSPLPSASSSASSGCDGLPGEFYTVLEVIPTALVLLALWLRRPPPPAHAGYLDPQITPSFPIAGSRSPTPYAIGDRADSASDGEAAASVSDAEHYAYLT